MWGREHDDVTEVPAGGNPEASRSGKGAPRQSRSNPKSRPDARHQAINDAQESLQSLLNPQTSDGHPQVLSSSGAIRGPKTGRIAGPTADTRRNAASSRGGATSGGRLGTGAGSSTPALPGGPGALSIPGDANDAGEVRAVPGTRLGIYGARASAGVQAIRERADLLLGSPDGELGLDPLAVQATKRSASQWITRYATHLVILVVVGALAAFGGLKAFTAQSAYTHSLSATQAYTGTDLIQGDNSNDGSADIDAQNFQLAMPRTELNTAGQASGSASKQVVTKDVTRYTVVKGDTIGSIAARFDVLPETVMGSNGIFDSQEALAPGRVLVVPPVDGMYYVAGKSDTIDSVAHRFQVDPSVIAGYAPNKIGADGALKEGQALVVPGGMMPPRETVLTYTVRSGDTLRGIAARFGVDVPTMVNSNKIPDPDNLQPGSQLRVLPVPGVEYKVKKGDTLTSIADRLGVTPQMILDYQPNHLTVSSKLKIDQVMLVPGGDPNSTPDTQVVAAARIQPDSRSSVRPADNPGNGSSKGDGGTVKSASNSSSSKSSSTSNNSVTKPPPQPAVKPQPKVQPKTQPPSNNSPKVGTGSLMWPVNAVITQYFSRAHNGLDLATAAGTPIHAADSGKVVWSGWRTDGLGYCVIIDHLDGLTTVYGHQIRQPIVYVGQYVTRGQVIGYVGSTGHSTGPHVHFMVKAGGASSHDYRNPLAYLGR